MTRRLYADRDLWPAGQPIVERVLVALGADAEFLSAVLGDMAEEFAARAERDGVGAARIWYGREALRSAPHVVRNTIMQGSPRARTRLAMTLAAVAMVVTVPVVAMLLRNGPPARLVADSGGDDGGIVVNNLAPVILGMRVLDKAGHVLQSNGVRYRWAAGAPLNVSPTGVVKCTHHGDATVHASLGDIATSMQVLCRPVLDVQAASWMDFVVGDTARPLPFKALGVDGRVITQLRGAATVMDTSVAWLEGTTVVPRAAGRTMVEVQVGDRQVRMLVFVNERVASFEGLRPDQRLVARDVKLARGDTIRWTVPRGTFWVKYLTRRAAEAPPTITLEGAAGCRFSNGLHTYWVTLDVYEAECTVASAGGKVMIAHGDLGADVVEGTLVIQRSWVP